MRHFVNSLGPIVILQLAVIPLIPASCAKEGKRNDAEAYPVMEITVEQGGFADNDLMTYQWDKMPPPVYDRIEGGPYAGNLFVDAAFDPEGITVVGDRLRFYLAPSYPPTPSGSGSPHNYRSEIHTSPWEIRHPPGTEQWIGWKYTFGNKYVIDSTAPITIFQNHPGIRGESPQLELEIAALDDPRPAIGGEIQVVNAANSDRLLTKVRPQAGDELAIVIHVIYGDNDQGLFQVWLNGEMYYDKQAATVYTAYPWGGNNKWGIYHHTFNNNPQSVAASINAGSGIVELYMNTLRLLTRTPNNPDYLEDAFDLVRPDQ